MSLMPAVSITARIAPPEMTPVPGAAVSSTSRADPNLRFTSCGMVVPTIGTVIMLRLATSIPLRIASVTSLALPMPAPTRPFKSPTTISALNENLRPPLTTLDTRLTRTTRSESSDRSPLECGYRLPIRLLKLQSGFAGSVRQSLDSAVVEESAPVEDHRAHARGLRLRGDRLAALGRLRHAIALRLQVDRGSRRQRAAGSIVDELDVEVVEAAEDGKTRTLLRAADVQAHAPVPLRTGRLAVVLLDHEAISAPLPALPALRRIFSPRYMTPLPL